MDRYERVERVDYKSARDIVTEVDHLSEELIIAAIRARHPADGILAEETGAQPTSSGDLAASGRGRIWIIDPIDGTINYANGIPVFCVSIALAIDAGGVGVVLDPTRDDLFAANGRRAGDPQRTPIAVSDKETLTDSRRRGLPRRSARVVARPHPSQAIGSRARGLVGAGLPTWRTFASTRSSKGGMSNGTWPRRA